jgi:hypothetical protein
VADASPADPVTEPTTTSSSQQIAQAVLANKTTETPLLNTAPGASEGGTLDMSKLATALASGMGGTGNPIHVTLNERMLVSFSCSSRMYQSFVRI